MRIVNRIRLPKSIEVASLYIQCHEGAAINYQRDDSEVVLHRGGTISTNTYFNSFYEKLYAKYTNLDSIYYSLRVEGSFQISVYREDGESRESIYTEKFEECELSDSIKIPLPNLTSTEVLGRIYFEVICLSEQGLFKEGAIATEQIPTQEVTLGIISCTFKKENYIKKTVTALLQDRLLKDKDLKLFVVDNGRTLSHEDFADSRVQLIANRNLGGSGGFTRGLVEALQADTYSHFLLMDDDIELDGESVYRLFSLYEYAKVDIAVAGGMLDGHKKHVLHEAGALYGKVPSTSEFQPFLATALNPDLDLQNPASLNQLLQEEDIDYGAFWFFAFSKEVVEKIGLLLPIFIKIDDIEFCLRIKEHCESKIVAFPSIAVWHDPWYAKPPLCWDSYYIHRNYLITHAIHDSLKYIDAVKQTTKCLVLALLFFEYNAAELVIKAFEDYMQGPEFIKNADPEVLHADVVKLSKSSSSQKIQQNYSPANRLEATPNPSRLKKILSLLTLNGHLLPNFLLGNDEVMIWQGPGASGQRSKAFAKKRVLLFQEESAYLFQNEINKPIGIKLLTKWFKVAASSGLKWSLMSAAWKNAAKELTSTIFWQQYLGLKE